MTDTPVEYPLSPKTRGQPSPSPHVNHGQNAPGAHLYPTNPLGENLPGIATGREVEWQPLVDYRRAGVSETTIHGAVAWSTPQNLLHSFGGQVLCYGRSMMKPLMIKPLARVLEPLTNSAQRAITVASHNGTTQHVAVAQSLLKEDEWGLMQTPLDVPLVQFGRQVRRPRRWYHTCSGEHAGILCACRELGWSRAGYMLPSHPFFRSYLSVVRHYLGEDWSPKRVARDGCGLPTVSHSVAELARIYAGLARDRDDDWIWNSMVAHPDLVGGFGRLDSTIIKACKGQVIAKEGADGLLGLAICHPDYPEGLGIVIKIAHGWNPQATWYVARAVLGVLGFEFRNPLPLHRQKAFLVEGLVPEAYRGKLRSLLTWDEWDPNRDSFEEYAPENPHASGQSL